MLTSNNMRFGTDIFNVTIGGGSSSIDTQSGGDDTLPGGDEPIVEFVKKALLISNEGLDAQNASKVDNFIISGDEPENSARRFMLKINDKIYKFNGSNLAEFTGELTADSVLENGNTAAELNSLSNINALVGKKIYPIIALSGTDSARPTAKISLKITTTALTKTKSVDSAQFPLPTPAGVVPRITDISADTTCTGGGSVAVKVKLQAADNSWGAWINLADAANQDALAVQFRSTYSVNTVNSDSAKVNSVSVNYVANEPEQIVSGDLAEIYSIVPNFETDLRLCYVIVRHKKLLDSTIDAFVNFFPAPKHRERIYIGKGTGSTKQYILGVEGIGDVQIDHNTLEVFVDGVKTGNFDYNTETSELTINARNNKPVTVSYDYEIGLEDWRAMEVEFNQQPYLDGSYMTRWSYTLPDDAPAAQGANIRIKLARPQGNVKNFSLGKATGLTQQIVLPHWAIPDTISINADFTYEEETRILTFVAAKNTDLVISYKFRGEQHKIYSWAAGFSAA